MGIIGALVLLVLGVSSLRTSWRGVEVSVSGRAPKRVSSSSRRSALEGFGLSFVNPYSVIFWLSLNSVLLPGHHPAAELTLGSFFLAIAGWGVALAFGASSCRFLRSARTLRLTSILCGLVFLVSGLSLGHAFAVTGSF